MRSTTGDRSFFQGSKTASGASFATERKEGLSTVIEFYRGGFTAASSLRGGQIAKVVRCSVAAAIPVMFVVQWWCFRLLYLFETETDIQLPQIHLLLWNLMTLFKLPHFEICT